MTMHKWEDWEIGIIQDIANSAEVPLIDVILERFPQIEIPVKADANGYRSLFAFENPENLIEYVSRVKSVIEKNKTKIHVYEVTYYGQEVTKYGWKDETLAIDNSMNDCIDWICQHKISLDSGFKADFQKSIVPKSWIFSTCLYPFMTASHWIGRKLKEKLTQILVAIIAGLLLSYFVYLCSPYYPKLSMWLGTRDSTQPHPVIRTLPGSKPQSGNLPITPALPESLPHSEDPLPRDTLHTPSTLPYSHVLNLRQLKGRWIYSGIFSLGSDCNKYYKGKIDITPKHGDSIAIGKYSIRETPKGSGCDLTDRDTVFEGFLKIRIIELRIVMLDERNSDIKLEFNNYIDGYLKCHEDNKFCNNSNEYNITPAKY